MRDRFGVERRVGDTVKYGDEFAVVDGFTRSFVRLKRFWIGGFLYVTPWDCAVVGSKPVLFIDGVDYSDYIELRDVELDGGSERWND